MYYAEEQEFRRIWDAIWCLKSCSGGLSSIRYVGNGITTIYSFPGGNVSFISTDGRVNDPVTEYTVSGTSVNFIGAPAIGSIIQIFY